jgi:hypothetical protein
VVNLDADLSGEYLDMVNGKEVLNQTVYPVPILTILTDDLAQRIDRIPDAMDVVAVKHVTATAPHAYEIDFMTNHMEFNRYAAVLTVFCIDVVRLSPFHQRLGASLTPLKS